MPPDLLPTLLGALPELGTVGVALVVLTVVRRQQQADTADLRAQMMADRAYFSEERARIRAEAQADARTVRDSAAAQRTELLTELRESRAELREADREADLLRAQLQAPATTVLPHPSRHRLAGGGG